MILLVMLVLGLPLAAAIVPMIVRSDRARRERERREQLLLQIGVVALAALWRVFGPKKPSRAS